MKLAIAALALAIPLGACNRPLAPDNASATEAQAVRDVEARLQRAFKARDAAAIAALYASDADIIVPEQPIRLGRDQLKGTENDFRDPNFALEFANVRTEVSGEMAFTRGTFTVSYTDPGNGAVSTQRGNYVTVFRKDAAGDWKIVADISTPGARTR